MRTPFRLALLCVAVATTACSSATQFSGTVVTRNASPVRVSLYEVAGLERTVPSLPALAPADVKIAMLGPMRAPDSLRIRWSYAEKWAPSGDPSATSTSLTVPRPPDARGAGAADLLITFTAERRWVAAWSPR